MADQKISELTAITGANTADDDLLVIVDTSTGETKKITLAELEAGIARGDMTFGDNDKAIFGASSDLQIYHDGSTSLISDTGTGNLTLTGGAEVTIENPARSQYMLRAADGGAVTLYNAGNAKLATTSTGIDVTGTATMDGLTVDGDVSVSTSSATTDGTDGAFVDINNTNGTTSVVSGVRFLNGGTAAYKGAVFFEDLAGDGRGDVVIASNDVASGAATVGLADQRLRVSRSGDISFYEDTGTTAKFFWDASAESLGIGTSSPNAKADLVGGDVTGGLKISQDTTTSAFFAFGADANETRITSSSYGGYKPLTVHTGGSERMRITSSGDLLVGKTTNDSNVEGAVLYADSSTGASASFTSDGIRALILNRKSSDGLILDLRKDGSTVGSIGNLSTSMYIGGNSQCGVMFNGAAYNPTSSGGTRSDATVSLGDSGYRYKDLYLSGGVQISANGQINSVSGDGTLAIGGTAYYKWATTNFYPNVDDTIDLGLSIRRWDDVYATNGTIQTSDANEKQDIAELDEAEQRVAQACKGLLRKFRWIDAVAEKGDDARIHFGIIAQDLQAAFEAEGLDAHRYAMFISTTWWETTEEVPAVEAVEATYDEEGNVLTEAVEAKEAYTRTNHYETAEEAPEGAVERTRLGVRYPELLAFIIATL